MATTSLPAPTTTSIPAPTPPTPIDHDHDHAHEPAAPAGPTAETTAPPAEVPATGTLLSGDRWTEVETPHEDPRAQNNLEIRGAAYTVDNSPEALDYIDWVETAVIPTSPRWVQEIWPSVRVTGVDSLGSANRGYMYGWFSDSYPALLQINLTAANGEPVNRDPYGELHVITIHELAHACDFDTSCDFGTVDPYDLVEPFSHTSAWQTAVDRHEQLGSDVPPGLEIVAEIVTFHATGQALATYLNPSAWTPAATEGYYELADARDVAYDVAHAAWTDYKAGGSEQDYQSTYGSYQVTADAAQDYWDSVQAVQTAHELDLCQDLTAVLVGAGVHNAYRPCE